MKWLPEIVEKLLVIKENKKRKSFKEIKSFIKIANIIDNIHIVLESIDNVLVELFKWFILFFIMVVLIFILKNLIFEPEKYLGELIKSFFESS